MVNSEFIHITKCGGTSIRKSLNIEKMGHNPVRKNNDIDEDTFVYSFVRNPFDRFASFYRWHYRKNSMGVRDISFQKWWEHTILLPRAPYHYNPDYWNSCYWWLSDKEGNLRADFVGRVENMQEDWEKLCEKLGKSVILEKHNTTTDVDVETEYTPRMKDYMLQKYAKDFETWYPNMIE